MSGYHAIASMLRVDKSDDCIWLVDESRPRAQNIHMTPDQATAAGEALLEAGGSSSDSACPSRSPPARRSSTRASTTDAPVATR